MQSNFSNCNINYSYFWSFITINMKRHVRRKKRSTHPTISSLSLLNALWTFFLNSWVVKTLDFWSEGREFKSRQLPLLNPQLLICKSLRIRASSKCLKRKHKTLPSLLCHVSFWIITKHHQKEMADIRTSLFVYIVLPQSSRYIF